MTKDSVSKHWYIFGLGKSGRSSLRYLQNQGELVFAWDDTPSAREDLDDTLLQSPDSIDWQEIHSIILSPGIPHEGPNAHPALEHAKSLGIPLVSDVVLFLERALENPLYKIIGITGTNGKSTTTALLGHLLQAHGKDAYVGGNIGTPVLDLPEPTYETYYVLELSSYQLTLCPPPRLDCSILLNISPDHLAYHGTMENYIGAKERIFDWMNPAGSHGIIGIDDSYTQKMIQNFPEATPVSATSEEGDVYMRNNVLVDSYRGREIPLPLLPNLAGTHNAQNIVACYEALTYLLQGAFRIETFIKGLTTFKSLPHRQEVLRKIKGVTFVNDSKATNMNATEKSLKTFSHIHWILGGQGKDGESPLDLKPYFSHVEHVYLVGESSKGFAETIEGQLPYTVCDTIEQGVKTAFQKAHPDHVILLAPGCASFDQFKNFEERGDAFKACVKKLEA